MGTEVDFERLRETLLSVGKTLSDIPQEERVRILACLVVLFDAQDSINRRIEANRITVGPHGDR